MPLMVMTTVSDAVPGSVVLPIAAIPLCVASAMPLVVVGASLLSIGWRPLVVRAEGGRSLAVGAASYPGVLSCAPFPEGDGRRVERAVAGHAEVGRVDPVGPRADGGPGLLRPMNRRAVLVRAPGLTLVSKAVRRGGHPWINNRGGHPRANNNHRRIGASKLTSMSSTMRSVQNLCFSASPLRCTTGLLLHGVI